MLGLFLQGVDTEDDVLVIRSEAIAMHRKGAVYVTSWGSEGTNVSKFSGMRLDALIKECNAFLQSLDPDTYGKRITRTKPRFN